VTPEERAARALLDNPYRTPKVRIAREISDAIDEARAGFRETLAGLAALAEQAHASAGEASAACREAIDALAREIQRAQSSFR